MTWRPPVRSVVIWVVSCIGHVARMYAKVENEKVITVLVSKLEDNALSGRAQAALDDVDTFVK